MTEKSTPAGGELTVPAASGSGMGRLVFALFLAAIAVAAAVYGVRQGVQVDPRLVLWGGAALAVIGFIALLALIAGVVRLGRGADEHAFLHAVADAIGHPVVVTDRNGRGLFANDAYRTLLTRAGGGRLVGMDLLLAPYTEFSTAVYQIAQGLREGRSETRELRVAAASAAPCAMVDRPVWVRLSARVAGGQGRDGVRLWSLEDISDERARQEQAFSRLQFIITYLDNAPAGFFSTMADGRVDYINATLAQWLGIDLTEAESANLTLAGLLGESAARLISGVEARSGSSVTESFSIDLPNRATGGLIPVQLIHHVEFEGGGQAAPSRTVVIPRNLTGAAANRAEISAPRLSRFINNAPIGIAEIDKEGGIRMANAAFIDLSQKVRRGAELAAAIVPTERDALQKTLAAALSAEGSLHQIEANVEGERPRNVLFTFTRLAAEDDTAVVFAVDKTESKSLEVQLAQSQKLLAVGQLASGIAHDFNNVLTPIIGFADLLLAKMRPTDPAFADVMNIKQNANRAANLVRQLLAFSRKQTLQPKVHVLTEALSDLGNLLGRVLGEKVELKISHDRGLGFVLADIHQFEQVIINLAVNARDAMPHGGTLTVRTYNVSEEDSRGIAPHLLPPGEYVACEVQDTGTGIPEHIREKIWEPFFSTKDVGKGTGLGLSTVYGIVKQTGGFIFCDSEVDKGTTFRIYLPRYYPQKVDEPVPEEKPAEPQKRDYTGKERILLVEDEDAVRAFAVRALTSRGYTVIEADSGESAIEKINGAGKPFDLIISDVVMPEMDGPTLLRELRKRGIETRFVFVSGYPGEQFEQDLEGFTGYSFMPKPFSLKQLVEKVKEAME